MFLYREDDSNLTKIMGRRRALTEEPEYCIVDIAVDGSVYTTTAEAVARTKQLTGFCHCGSRREDADIWFAAKELPMEVS